jgi:hypothetical protein
LYFLIKSKPNQKQSYYALKLAVSDTTVRTAIKTLRGLKLISVGELSPRELAEQQLKLWLDQKKRRVTAVNRWQLSRTDLFQRIGKKLEQEKFLYFFQIEEEPRHTFDRVIDWFGNKMIARGYSRTEIDFYWNDVAGRFRIEESNSSLHRFEQFLWLSFLPVFEHAEEKTLHNASAGTFGGANSLGLLKRITDEAISQIQVALDNGFGSFQWKATF